MGQYTNILRTLFYAGIAILALNNLPGIRDVLDPFLQFNLFNGITINLVISAAVLVGAYMAYKREFG